MAIQVTYTAFIRSGSVGFVASGGPQNRTVTSVAVEQPESGKILLVEPTFQVNNAAGLDVFANVTISVSGLILTHVVTAQAQASSGTTQIGNSFYYGVVATGSTVDLNISYATTTAAGTIAGCELNIWVLTSITATASMSYARINVTASRNMNVNSTVSAVGEVIVYGETRFEIVSSVSQTYTGITSVYSHASVSSSLSFSYIGASVIATVTGSPRTILVTYNSATTNLLGSRFGHIIMFTDGQVTNPNGVRVYFYG